MRDFYVNQYLKPYEGIARQMPRGIEALERLSIALREGKGLCKGEQRFFYKLKFLSGQYHIPTDELDEFIDEAKASIKRDSTENDKIFWDNFFKELNNP